MQKVLNVKRKRTTGVFAFSFSFWPVVSEMAIPARLRTSNYKRTTRHPTTTDGLQTTGRCNTYSYSQCIKIKKVNTKKLSRTYPSIQRQSKWANMTMRLINLNLKRLGACNSTLNSHFKFTHGYISGCTEPKSINSKYSTCQSHILIPQTRHSSLHCKPLCAT